MPEFKKVLITISSDLLNEAEALAKENNSSLDQVVQTALHDLLKKTKQEELVRQMEKGYQEMADINIKIAEEFLHIENEVMSILESDDKNGIKPPKT
jgi:CopG family transcriptional regulator/antitoxin EndoAI